MLPKPRTRLGPSESLRPIFRLLIAGGGQGRSIPFQFTLLNAGSTIDKCLLFNLDMDNSLTPQIMLRSHVASSHTSFDSSGKNQ